MVSVTYIHADGREVTVEGREGASVMETARANGIDGIVGECGGAMACATCHCYVDPDWQAATGTREADEDLMLDCAAAEVRDTSRLSCQIRLTPALDGLRVELPAEQL